MPVSSTQWLSIDDAPRDGTRILATIRSSEQGSACVDTVYWARGTLKADQGWRAADSSTDCVIAYHERELTGWMPMPSPLLASRLPEPMRPEDVAETGGSGI